MAILTFGIIQSQKPCEDDIEMDLDKINMECKIYYENRYIMVCEDI